MARAAQIYDFSMAAGETFVLPVEGTYYRIRSATGSVRVKRDDGSMLLLEVGQGENNQLFRRLTIEDTSGAANSGTIIVADNNFVDERVSGEVLTMPGAVARTLAKQAFAGGASVGALAGNFSAVQLWNPAGSGKNIVVSQVIATSYTASTNTHFRTSSAALTTLNNNPKNKFIGGGGAASIAEVRSDQTAALAGIDHLFPFIASSTSVSSQYRFDEPIVIAPGAGLLICASIVNAAMVAAFDFWERPL